MTLRIFRRFGVLAVTTLFVTGHITPLYAVENDTAAATQKAKPMKKAAGKRNPAKQDSGSQAATRDNSSTGAAAPRSQYRPDPFSNY